MNEPLDSRPQRTVNRLRLLVLIPAALAGVGVLFLAVQLAQHFRAMKEPPSRDYPPNPATMPGVPGRPTSPLSVRLTAPDRSAAAQAKSRADAVAPVPGSAAPPLGAPVVAADAPSGLIPPARGALAVIGLPARDIVGRVFLRGAPPAEKAVPMDPLCGKLHAGNAQPSTRLYVVGTNGSLADVFIELKDFPAGLQEVPGNPVEIRQRGCEYLPYVSAARVGQIIRVFNDDPLMHNVHPTPIVDGNLERNRAQMAGGAPLDFSFPKPEFFLRFRCDVHPWMFAYVSVVEHPFFAVSAADGHFALPEPPAGEYTLKFIHRKAGEKLVLVSVRPGKRTVVAVTLDLADPLKHEAVVTME